MDEKLIRNSTSFPVKVSARLRELFEDYQKILRGEKDVEETEYLIAKGLKYYQYLVRSVMTNPDFGIGKDGNARGLLIYHTMGMGKTYLAVATAISLWDVRLPLVIVAKSLQKNFINTIRKYIKIMNPDDDEDELNDKQTKAVRKFKFVSIDAYNMATTVAKITSGTLNDRLIIIDEAHNLFRGIINNPSEKTNARKLYEMVMNARNIRLLFLTGTPASKDPFELVPCFNMLAGYDLLPAQYDVFYKNFVDTKNVTIKNRNKLANRIVGLVSHVSHTLPSEPVDSADSVSPSKSIELRTEGGFPEELKTIIERVEMSKEQYRQYLFAREKEESEGKGGSQFSGEDKIKQTADLALPGSESNVGSTYHVYSRSISNFNPPGDPNSTKKIYNVAAMYDEDFNNKSSPKAIKLISNLAESPGPALVYSQFVNVGGLAVIARFLKNAGYKSIRSLENIQKHNKNFAIISGDIKSEDRSKIQEVFNSPENAHGELIKVLLVSKTGTEGLDLKGIRQIHIFEPYWDKSREDQVKARGIRLGSHDHLPVEEREVQPFLYISIENKEMFEGMQPSEGGKLIEKITIDEKFHDRALIKHTMNNEFRELLREVSLECSINKYSEQCRVCVPTDAPLFHEDPIRDLRLPDPCKTLTETELTVTEITLPPLNAGEVATTYYYSKDPTSPFGIRFFKYDDELKTHSPIDPSTGLFMRLLEIVEKY